MEALTDYISIVPSNLRIRKRAGKKESEFILEWDNELKAAHNVRGYELELGDGQIYKVMAPQRRVVLENPVDGQKVNYYYQFTISQSIKFALFRSLCEQFTKRMTNYRTIRNLFSKCRMRIRKINNEGPIYSVHFNVSVIVCSFPD